MIDYYQQHASDYFNSTVNVNPSSFLNPLIKYLQSGDTVLDIGCGSGRDLLWLSKKGFQATGFERSPGLAQLARQQSLQPVIEGDFRSYDFSVRTFHALLLVGSLVHLCRDELPMILQSVCRALLPSGYILLTMKEGDGHQNLPDGRLFTLWSRGQLETVFAENCLEVVDFSRKKSMVRSGEIWLGYVLKPQKNNLKTTQYSQT